MIIDIEGLEHGRVTIDIPVEEIASIFAKAFRREFSKPDASGYSFNSIAAAIQEVAKAINGATVEV